VNAAGGKGVGLTGADAQLGLCAPIAPIRTQSGEIVDLGLVGEPSSCNTVLLQELLQGGYVPVVASIGITADGALLNVNADTFAAYLAGALAADRLIIAGTTPGVLDETGGTIASLGEADIDAMTAAGTAHSGMIAKLAACRHAASQGVAEVSIVTGRDTADFETAPGTTIKAEIPTRNSARASTPKTFAPASR
jgi:acetylglutamate kinase